MVSVDVAGIAYSPDRTRALAHVVFDNPSGTAYYDMVLQKQYGNWTLASVWLGYDYAAGQLGASAEAVEGRAVAEWMTWAAWCAAFVPGMVAGGLVGLLIIRPVNAVLGWLFEDSGVTVPAAALPFLLPLVAVILSSVPRDDAPEGSEDREPAAATV